MSDIPVIQVTDPADQPPNVSINTIGQRGRASSDSNLLAPEGRNWLGSSLNPNSTTGHAHCHAYNSLSGPHLMLRPQHTAKALVADPPQANKEEVEKARSKLWASNPHLHL